MSTCIFGFPPESMGFCGCSHCEPRNDLDWETDPDIHSRDDGPLEGATCRTSHSPPPYHLGVDWLCRPDPIGYRWSAKSPSRGSTSCSDATLRSPLECPRTLESLTEPSYPSPITLNSHSPPWETTTDWEGRPDP